ncbi:hypothetical protein E2562_025197 [Oryza meyeriana var. granulata]|uniref:Uncharacterized protein n=1 Tax=Oryza meyeriana var. granulata TaxID=110450 RepID=A0A6G1E1P2_9ORYZ|nr:hypothetical protein E2562_025197 [Oryza meyeriana var. granulata]
MGLPLTSPHAWVETACIEAAWCRRAVDKIRAGDSGGGGTSQLRRRQQALPSIGVVGSNAGTSVS